MNEHRCAFCQSTFSEVLDLVAHMKEVHEQATI